MGTRWGKSYIPLHRAHRARDPFRRLLEMPARASWRAGRLHEPRAYLWRLQAPGWGRRLDWNAATIAALFGPYRKRKSKRHRPAFAWDTAPATWPRFCPGWRTAVQKETRGSIVGREANNCLPTGLALCQPRLGGPIILRVHNWWDCDKSMGYLECLRVLEVYRLTMATGRFYICQGSGVYFPIGWKRLYTACQWWVDGC